jgi:D-alanyl-D-alanine carboxypeptidase/D-alanyl-D-alanine-endopeptidase (penicillin-binding protein 4)
MLTLLLSAMALAQTLLLASDSAAGTQERLLYLSQMLDGTPYKPGPMGEGDTRGPLVNLDSVDCVTYIEHVLALATSKDTNSFFDKLQQIRYKDGKIGYETRNHYFWGDWIANNPALVAPATLPGDTVISRTLDKKTFFANEKINYPGENPSIEIRYLPMDKAIRFADTARFAQDSIWGVAFVLNMEGIDVAHTGFVVARPGAPLVLRHASSKGSVREESLAEYLRSKPKWLGPAFFKFLP